MTMPTATVNVKVQVSTWRARAWIGMCRVLAPVVGRERTFRWATDGAHRLTRFRITGQKWRHL